MRFRSRARGEPFTRPMLMSSDDRAIDIMNGPVYLARGIRLLLDGLKEALPDAGFAPAIEAAGHHPPSAISFRQIAPGSASMQKPQNTVDNASMVGSRSTRFRLLRGKQRLEPLPLRVA
jgi:hypothetical protein